MARLQISVPDDVEAKLRDLAVREGISLSAAGAQLLSEAVSWPSKDPWFSRKPFPSRRAKKKQVSGKDHDLFLYGIKARR